MNLNHPYRFFGYIALFLSKCFHLLTNHDKDLLLGMFHPDIQFIIQARAFMALKFILPLMKGASLIKNANEYKEFLLGWVETAKSIVRFPHLLMNNPVHIEYQHIEQQVLTARNYIIRILAKPNCLIDDHLPPLELESDVHIAQLTDIDFSNLIEESVELEITEHKVMESVNENHEQVIFFSF